MILVLDDLLDTAYADKIESECVGVLRYGYAETSVSTNVECTDPRIFDAGFFTCQFCNDFDTYWAPKLNPFAWYLAELMPLVVSLQARVPEIEFTFVSKMTANLQLQQKDAPVDHYNVPHWDADATNKFYSMVYYTTDSDGDTVLFNEFHDNTMKGQVQQNLTICQRVTPKKNRAVIFESNRYHTSTFPITSKKRLVINVVMRAHHTS
jgi:hypothetical protein